MATHLRAHGVQLRLSSAVEAFEPSAEGEGGVRVRTVAAIL